MRKPRLFTQTVLATTLASVLYGLIHDQVTIRICPEYFTVWHPHVSESRNFTLIALIWGVIATWWMGLLLGVLLGAAATIGRRPVPPFKYIGRCILWILVSTAVVAILSGLIAWQTHAIAPSFVMGPAISQLDKEVQQRFTIDLFIHNASYNFGTISAIIACIFIWRYRVRLAPHASRPT